VPFLDVQATYKELQHELDAAYRRVMATGQYILGEEVEAFEAEFAAYCGVQHCVAVGNGLDALHILLRVFGIGPGDDVIVPAHTFIATWLAVRMTGANLVPVDVDPGTRTIDVAAVSRAVTRRTRAILPVHLYGAPADMDPLRLIAREHDIRILEDAAQAHGATYHGRRVGALGDAAAWSFYPGKNLGAFGDGGAITTDDYAIADVARTFRNYGSRSKYVHDIPGVNSRLDSLQAAFLRTKLAYLDKWNARRRVIAEAYLARLQGIPGLTLPTTLDDSGPVWHLFVIEHHLRDELGRLLAERGIGTLIHYPQPPHLSGAFLNLGFGNGSFPVAEHLANSVLSLPMGPHLTTEQALFVADTLAVITASRSS
jgi:dTDP-3-amino-3,4,6-trideoxy-alpha-D-glucose transaminase